MSLIIIHPAAPRAAPIYTKAFNLFLPTDGYSLFLSFLLWLLYQERSSTKVTLYRPGLVREF